MLAVNSIYLLSVRALEAATGKTYQDWFYLVMFLLHLVLGLAIVLPVVVFGILHLKNARHRPNRRAVRVGYALFTTALVLLASGFVLTRIEGVIEVRDPAVRSTAYWLHVATPVIAAWLFVLHRLAGKRIRWKVGLRWAAVALLVGNILQVVFGSIGYGFVQWSQAIFAFPIIGLGLLMAGVHYFTRELTTSTATQEAS